MSYPSTRLSTYLTYAGALPFVIGALLSLLGIAALPVIGDSRHVVSVYGLVIASFMAGVHWGQHLSRADSLAKPLAISSNLHAIVLWLGYIVLPASGFILLLMLSFALLLAMDWRLHQQQLITTAYYQLRCRVTTIVLLSLLLLSING